MSFLDGTSAVFPFDNSLQSLDLNPVYVPQAETVYAVDITCYVPGTGVVTKYYATHGIVYSGNFYEPRLKQPGNVQQTMFSEGTTRGNSETGFGEIILINSDGGLDAFINYGFDGRSIVLRKIIAGVATILMSCSMEQPVPTWDTVPIRIKDKQQLFNVPIQPTKYAGSNTLPAGVEGVDDIKGKPKPLLFGQVNNATPVCVNTSRLIYQGHETTLYSIPAVYDKGVALTAGTARANQAALEANDPLPGTYDTWLGGGMFRLGSSPAGQVTFDGVEGATVGDRTAAQIAKRLALRAISSGEIDSADVTALDTANSSIVGIYISEERTISSVLDEVLNSVGAWYSFDSLGVLNMGQLVAPSGTPIATLTATEILEIERLATNDDGRGVPPYKVNLNYGKNNTVQNAADLAGAVAVINNNSWTDSNINVNTNKTAYGNGVYVLTVIGVSSNVYTSSDGITWTARTVPDENWRGIAFGAGLFVMVNSSGITAESISTSPDGITWTTRTTTGYFFRDVIFANGVFVASTDYDHVALVSSNGTSWTTKTFPVATDRSWGPIGYGAGRFVIFSINQTASMISNDNGDTWEAHIIPDAYWGNLTFARGAFVAQTNAGTMAVMYSQDGINWLKQDWFAYAGGSGPQAVDYDGRFISLQSDGTLYESINGVVWNKGNSFGSKIYSANSKLFKRDYSSGILQLWSGDTNLEIISLLDKEYRTISVNDSSVLTKHPTAGELNINTLIVNSSDAATEAARILALRKVDRDFLSIKVHAKVLPADLLGKVIQLTIPRYGYDAGKLFVITGATYDFELETITLKLWG